MASVKLEYHSNPDQSFANKNIPLTIVATNNTGDSIIMTKDDSIQIKIPDGMLKDLNVKPTTPTDSGYYAESGQSPGQFILKANPFYPGGVTIKNKSFWQVSFESAETGKTADTYSIDIAEKIGGTSGSTQINFTIEKEQPMVIAWLSPRYIGDLQTSKLFWQIPEGTTKLYVSGFPNHGDVNIDPITIDGNIEVYMEPGPNDTQQIYSMTAVVGNQSIQSRNLVLQKNKPVISLFEAFAYNPDSNAQGQAVTEIGFNDDISLSWITQYSNSVILTTPKIPNELVFKRDQNRKFSPGKALYFGYYNFIDQLPAHIDYYLTANGMEHPAQDSIRLTFKPVKFLYFKYTDQTKKSVEFRTDPYPYLGNKLEYIGGKPQLTVYQPGGSSKVYFPEGVLDGTEPKV